MENRQETTVCEMCGKIILVKVTGAVPRYCSKSCANKAGYQRRKAELEQGPGEEMICARCGRKFWWNPPKKNAIRPLYCSKSCVTMASQARAADKNKAYHQQYYLDHKNEILEKWREKHPPRPKLTPEERKAKRRAYNREYWRRRRAKLKEEQTHG